MPATSSENLGSHSIALVYAGQRLNLLVERSSSRALSLVHDLAKLVESAQHLFEAFDIRSKQQT